MGNIPKVGGRIQVRMYMEGAEKSLPEDYRLKKTMKEVRMTEKTK